MAMDEVVQSLAHFRPRLQNHLTLSGLMSYLLQALMSTPVNVPRSVREALLELTFGANVARFGAFFLSDLDLDNVKSLGLSLGDVAGLDVDSFDTIRYANVTLGSLAPKVGQKGYLNIYYMLNLFVASIQRRA